MIALREKHYTAPFNRHPLGDKAVLNALTLVDVREFTGNHACRAGRLHPCCGR